MNKVTCPYCYEPISLAKLHFQCYGRSPVGEGCQRIQDETRERWTGYALPSWPTFPPPRGLAGRRKSAVCPLCQGIATVRACPTCHTPLPKVIGEDRRSPRIGLIGGKSAGKTVFLTVLEHELFESIRRRFKADVQHIGDSQAGMASTGQWLKAYQQALYHDKVLPNQTPSAARGLRPPVVLSWRQRRRHYGRVRPRSSIITFYDAAGEDMTTQDQINVQRYLDAVDALIVVLDPWQLPGAHARITVPTKADPDATPVEVLSRVTERLRYHERGGYIRIPVAVVFAKMDSFFAALGEDHPLLDRPREAAGYDEPMGRATHEHVRKLLDGLGADAIDTLLRNNYKRYRYFAVSALGREPDYHRDAVAAAGVHPHRVDEPLLWLLSLFRIVDQVK
ncbi:zinc ribbon domain-containing protein [Amycolatopsis sp. GM8]|uniref:TRAFAC clade GTPase domain-containing protein n=1 Tax=Amycolatopsis sp. GM8 TaxID=2896530 RepID=UPI001F3E1C7F|nr:zinc ribbon domain-containing protein [Amycolatopsis sp. GM8]